MTPEPITDWSMTRREKLIKIGAKVVSHARYVAFQMAEVAIPRHLFTDILRMIADLRPLPMPAPGRCPKAGRRWNPLVETPKQRQFWPELCVSLGNVG